MDNNTTNSNQNNANDFDEQKRQKLMDAVNNYLTTHKKPWYFHKDKIKPNNNPYSNDYNKANYFPVTKMYIGSIPFPIFKHYNTFVIGKRGFFSPKWDFWAKAKWPGFITSFVMWPGHYAITIMGCLIGLFFIGLIIFIVWMCLAI